MPSSASGSVIRPVMTALHDHKREQAGVLNWAAGRFRGSPSDPASAVASADVLSGLSSNVPPCPKRG